MILIKYKAHIWKHNDSYIIIRRYRLILLEVTKNLAKEIRANEPHRYLRKFLSSCDKAVDCMHEVNNFINRSLKDSDYRSSVRNIIGRITNMDPSEKYSLETT